MAARARLRLEFPKELFGNQCMVRVKHLNDLAKRHAAKQDLLGGNDFVANLGGAGANHAEVLGCSL